MNRVCYFLFFVVFLFTSCKDDEVPQSFLSGTYEIASENAETGIWYVQQYAFRADGTYDYSNFLRESENGSTLGFFYHAKGTYTLRGEDLALRINEASLVNYEEYPEGYTESLEDLETQQSSADFVESRGILKKLDSGARISLLFECNDTIGHLAMCIGELIYVKVG